LLAGFFLILAIYDTEEEIMLRKRKRPIQAQALLLAIVLSVSFIACKAQTLSSTSSSLLLPESGSASPQSSYAAVVNRVMPAVVTVRSDRRVRAAQQFPFIDDPFFHDFFGDRFRNAPKESPELLQRGVGSGVIVNADGYILTNHHVIDGAEGIKVDLNDGRTFDAKVVGSDKPSDLAVLKINASSLPVLQLGDSDHVKVGDVVLAIGNPLGVGQTVTMGIISAKGRQTGISNGSFEDFLQTDAAINQGNSGGALVNTNGELVGINSQILSPSGGSIGLGFSIPSNMARSVMDQLTSTGKVRRGQLGIIVQKVSTDIASSLGLKEARGVIISQVQPGSAAEHAGLKQGDIITALNGVAVDTPNSFRNQIAGTPPGTEVKLTVLRDSREQTLSAKLGEFRSETEDSAEASGDGARKSNTGRLGISIEALTPEVRSQLGLPAATQGVLISEVDPVGPAAQAGIQRGDVIEQVNQRPVLSAADLRTALERSGNRPALLLINRRGTTLFVTVTPRP
jgi:Do/DeqQ family serine protease